MHKQCNRFWKLLAVVLDMLTITSTEKKASFDPRQVKKSWNLSCMPTINDVLNRWCPQ